MTKLTNSILIKEGSLRSWGRGDILDFFGRLIVSSASKICMYINKENGRVPGPPQLDPSFSPYIKELNATTKGNNYVYMQEIRPERVKPAPA